MADRNWKVVTTASGALNIYVNGTLGLTISNAGAVTAAAGFGMTGALTVTGTLAITKAYGAAPAGSSTASSLTTTLTGDSGGTTDIRNLSTVMTASGGFGFASVLGHNNTVTLSHSAGTVTTAGAVSGVVSNTGNGAVTTLRGNDIRVTLTTGSGVVTEATGFYSRVSRTSGTGTATTARAFYADDSGGAYATTAIGFDSAAMGSAGTLTANFRAANSANTGRWAFLSTGTALSALAAGLRIGSVVAPVAMLDVTGSLAVSTTGTFGGLLTTVASATGSAGFNLPHGAAPTSPVNGDMWTTTAGAFIRINGVTKTFTLT